MVKLIVVKLPAIIFTAKTAALVDVRELEVVKKISNIEQGIWNEEVIEIKLKSGLFVCLLQY